jgi:hypothetical protein
MGKKKNKGNQDDDHLFTAQEANFNKNYVSLAMKARMEAAEANLG